MSEDRVLNSQDKALENWLTQNLRLTVFFNSPVTLTSELWSSVTGNTPDRITQEPRMNLQHIEGVAKNKEIQVLLTLATQPTRIDWQFMQLQDLKTGTPETLLKSLDLFCDLMTNWNNPQQTQRIAFGAIANKLFNTKEESYEWITQFLPFNIDKESSDFFYQINRPIKSSIISNLTINRLSKWSVETLITLAVDTFTPIRYPPQFSVRLELDISTDLDSSVQFSSENLPQIFDELVQIGKQMVLEGVRT